MPKSDYGEQTHAFMRGALAGICEVLLNYPLFKLKILFQSAEDTRDHPLKKLANARDFQTVQTHIRPAVRSLYKGMHLVALSMVPTTAVQMGTAETAEKSLRQNTEWNSFTIKTASAMLGGIVAATIASPIEYVIAQQQKSRKLHGHEMPALQLTKHMFKAEQWRVMTHGLFGTALRDGLFTVGYWAVCPLVRSEIEKRTDNKIVQALATNTMVAIPVSLLSQPFDTVKAHQQDTGQGSFATAFKQLTRNPKNDTMQLKPLFRGGFFRCARVASALTVIETVYHQYDALRYSKNH